MLFNSFEFLFLFLPITLTGYYLLGSRSAPATKLWLLVASIAFYGLAKLSSLPFLIGSILFNYCLAQVIYKKSSGDQPAHQGWLWLGISANLLFLSCFKYINFFVANFNAVVGTNLRIMSLDFPLGVSFFTLQQIMYLVDCYERLAPANSLLDHSLFVSFFSYVAAGPITRARQIVPQFNASDHRRANYDNIAAGVFLFSLGLFKKVVFADSLARIADAGFSSPLHLSAVEAWMASVAYCLQIYFDFSGYSDMAIASALMLSFELPINFNSPYRSTSIIEFWRRWHITLSNFITTYLYTPILRALGTINFAKAMFATFIAMVIAGLWHGPAWTYIIFGALHGIGLVVNQVWKKTRRKLPAALGWAMTFALVILAFVFFRSASVHDAILMLRSMAGAGNWTDFNTFRASIRSSEMYYLAPPILGALIAAFVSQNSNTLKLGFRPRWATALAIATVLAICFLFMNSTVAKEFVYFEF